MSTPTPYDDHYGTEQPVELRRQRLRRQPDPDADSVAPDSAESSDDEGDQYADPYLVGQDALAANEEPQPLSPQSAHRGFGTDDTDVDASPAKWGWRQRVNAALGLSLAPPADSPEARFRHSVRQIQQPLPGCMVVSVINLKGDAGKTSTTTMLANTFGQHRGRGVVAWDANESTGTLGDRAARGADRELGPWDVLENAHALASTSAVSGSLGHYLRLQPTHDEVLAAETSTSGERGIGWDECAAVMAVLRRHRDLIFVDTGNNAIASNWQWAVQHSDLLVIPLPLRRDAAIQALRMLDGIAARGFEHLVASAVVLTVVTPGSDAGLEAEIVEEFGRLGVRTIMRVPYEPMFATGGRIRQEQLQDTTVEAYTNVAATIADMLAGAAHNRTAEYFDHDAPQEFRRPSDAPRRLPRRDVAADRYRERPPGGDDRWYPGDRYDPDDHARPIRDLDAPDPWRFHPDRTRPQR